MTALKPSRSGLIGGAGFLVAGLAWILLGRQPGWFLAWFLAVAVVGLFLPGIANQVTLSRAHLALPGFVYALTASSLGGLALVVALAGLSDLVDGTVARRTGNISRAGAALDPIVDGVFYGAVAIGLAVGGAYPLWLGVVVLVRYFVPVIAGGVLVAMGRLPRFRHTFFGQLSTTVIATLLGGIALFRGFGVDVRNIVLGAAILFPLLTLLAWVELARTARELSRPGPEPE